MPHATPEAHACAHPTLTRRRRLAFQDYKAADPPAGRGIALRRIPLDTGPCEYLLLIDRHSRGFIEAKKEGTTLDRYRTPDTGRHFNVQHIGPPHLDPICLVQRL